MSSHEYDWLVLEADEEIVWSDEPALLGYAWAFAVGIVLVPLFGLGLLLIAAAYLHARNTAYVITTDSVFKKTGILSRQITDIGHGNTQDTGYRQGVAGRYFDFGTVQISTAGGSGVELSLRYVTEPLAVQSQLDSVALTKPSVAGSQQRAGRQPVRIDAETLDELVTEMRATRQALETIERHLGEQ